MSAKVCQILVRKIRLNQSKRLGSVWKVAEFEKRSSISGETFFKYASWGDFVTYSTSHGITGQGEQELYLPPRCRTSFMDAFCYKMNFVRNYNYH